MKVQSYLYFDGRCEEALNFYKTHLGAKVGMLMRFSENPDPQNSQGCATDTPIPGDKIMHVAFTIGETEILASDGMSQGKAEFKGFSLAISPPNEAEGKKTFNALAEGGHVQMPIAKTFFSPCFGMVVDKFGVLWTIVVPGEMPPK